MENVLLVVIMLSVFLLGYFLTDRIGGFLGKNYRYKTDAGIAHTEHTHAHKEKTDDDEDGSILQCVVLK